MFPYILLILVAFVFSFVAKSSSKGKLVIGNSKYVKNNNLAILVFFLVLFLILSFRDITIGRDVRVYEFLFRQYNRMEFWDLYKAEEELLYVIFSWLIGRVIDNFQIIISIIAAITLIPIYKQYAADKAMPFMKIVVFMNMTVFIMFFSGLRQGIAIAIGMIAYEYVKSKKVIPFIISVLIAIGFHSSAIVLFLMYPFYYWKLKKVSALLIIPVTIGIYIFNEPIFSFLSNIFNRIFGGEYDAEISATGAFTMIILFALFLILSYFIPDKKYMDEETIGLRNLLMLTLWLQCFAPLHNLAMRFNYYYIMFVPMVLPRILERSKLKYKKIAKLAGFVITAYLLYYYLSHTYRACVTGNSALDTYPYIPFWR